MEDGPYEITLQRPKNGGLMEPKNEEAVFSIGFRSIICKSKQCILQGLP